MHAGQGHENKRGKHHNDGRDRKSDGSQRRSRLFCRTAEEPEGGGGVSAPLPGGFSRSQEVQPLPLAPRAVEASTTAIIKAAAT